MSVFLLVHAAVARAQVASFDDAGQRVPPRRAVRPPPPLGFRAYVLYGPDFMTARNTFDAVLGTNRVSEVGAGAEILNVWHGVFVRGAGTRWRRSGSRVDLSGTSLGIPITVSMTPVEIAGGWRMGGGAPKAPTGLAAYVGGGFVRVHYRETSQFSTTGDDVDQMSSGYELFGGLELRLFRSIIVGAEGGYRGVPNAIGAGGISKTYHEADLGGGLVRILIGIRR